jgi:hypothetical protein
MKLNLSLAAAPLFGLLSLVSIACSSNTASPGGGGGGGNGGACTVASNGTVTSCFSWTNLSTAEISGICPTGNNSAGATYTTVASCPTANQVGSCTYTVTAGSTSYSDTETFYSTDGSTCSSVKQACTAGASGTSLTTSFSGNGC